jgi:hypothetical protein
MMLHSPSRLDEKTIQELQHLQTLRISGAHDDDETDDTTSARGANILATNQQGFHKVRQPNAQEEIGSSRRLSNPTFTPIQLPRDPPAQVSGMQDSKIPHTRKEDLSFSQSARAKPGFFRDRVRRQARSEPELAVSRRRSSVGSNIWSRIVGRASNASAPVTFINTYNTGFPSERSFISGRARLGNVVDDHSSAFSLLLALEASIYEVSAP